MSLRNVLNIVLSVLLVLGFSVNAKDFTYAKGEIVHKPAPVKLKSFKYYLGLEYGVVNNNADYDHSIPIAGIPISQVVTFSSKKQTSDVGLRGGYIFPFTQKLSVELGGGFYYGLAQKISGQWFQLPGNPDTSIDYNLQQMRLMAEARLMYLIMPKLSLNAGLGLGAAMLTFNNVSITKLSQAQAPFEYKQHSTTNIAVNADVSGSYQLTKQWFLNAGVGTVSVGKTKADLNWQNQDGSVQVNTIESKNMLLSRFWLGAEYRF